MRIGRTRGGMERERERERERSCMSVSVPVCSCLSVCVPECVPVHVPVPVCLYRCRSLEMTLPLISVQFIVSCLTAVGGGC